jgi:MoxR-like ATPase
MLRVELGYPSDEDESAVLDRYGTVSATGEMAPERTPPPPAVTPEQLEAARRAVDEMHVSAEVTAYVLAIAKATRDDPHIALGLSTRGALALLRAARVAAALRGSSFVTPDDVKLMAPWVIAHRLTLSAEAALERRKDQALVRSILERVPVPR